jgi:UDP-glucose 6-dehydrogenase
MNDYSLDADLLKAVEKLNESQKVVILNKLLKHIPNLD